MMRKISLNGAPRRMRILFLHPSDELYGADRVLLNLLSGIDRDRFEPLVVLANDLPYDGALSAELRARGIAVQSLPLAVARRKYLTPRGIGSFVANMYRAVRMLTQLMEAEKIDLVYSNTLAVWSGALAAAHLHLPHVWHAHEIVEHPTALRLFLQHFVPRYAQRVLCNSQATQDNLLITSRARSKGTILYNGIDPQEWIGATGRERVRAELGCADDELLIGFIGRISHFKAPDLFVEAACRLLAEHPRLRFVIVGAPIPGETHILQRVQQLIAASSAPERFRMLGFRRDVPDLTAALDIQVVPSRRAEPFGLVTIQAMFACKPVIAADVGATRELIHDGESGLVIPHEDNTSLAVALDGLIRDPVRRAALGTSARQHAFAKFTLDRQVVAFNQLLLKECEAARMSGADPTLASNAIFRG